MSGALFLPKGTAPQGGWPLISWAHGTVGVADVCAPSWKGRSPRDVAYLNHWLAQGYAIVATDYQGLGVPGGHPYLHTRAEAYSVLDAIRSVQSGNDPISNKVVVVGQSQGGAAAVATAGIAQEYAPELDIRGTAATGTPHHTPDDALLRRGPDVAGEELTYELLVLYLAKQADPNFTFEDHVTPAAMPAVRQAQDRCLHEVSDTVTSARLTGKTAFKGSPDSVLGKYRHLMGYDTLKLKGPVFMGAGSTDSTVPPDGQQRLAKDACAAGSTVEIHVYPGQDHSAAVNGSLVDSTPFVKNAFAGDRITGNCGEWCRTPPTSVLA